MKAIFKESDCSILNINYTKGQVVEVEKINNNEYMDIETGFYFLRRELELVNENTEDQHYDNTNGSLYKFAVDHGLNAYEFDIVKRIVRCRKKGQFVEDLDKTKRVIDLYLKESVRHD